MSTTLDFSVRSTWQYILRDRRKGMKRGRMVLQQLYSIATDVEAMYAAFDEESLESAWEHKRYGMKRVMETKGAGNTHLYERLSAIVLVWTQRVGARCVSVYT